jgi:hypothetical protein
MKLQDKELSDSGEFPVFSLVSRELPAENGSLMTAPSAIAR